MSQRKEGRGREEERKERMIGGRKGRRKGGRNGWREEERGNWDPHVKFLNYIINKKYNNK